MVYSDCDDEWQHKVLGIALVAEEIGKLSKLVFRYPPSPQHGSDYQSSIPSNNSTSHSAAKRDRSESDQNIQNEESEQKENIFFTLPPRVMAKLFRTKPSLCGQPMTLSIGGTIFCCRSVLLNQHHGLTDDVSVQSRVLQAISSQTMTSPGTQGASGESGDSSQKFPDGLVMFSIIVALLPTQHLSDETSQAPDSRGMKMDRMPTGNSDKGDDDSLAKGEFRSQYFPIVRRIHLSLSRLCKVLKREENRCIYMSRQVSMLLEIGNIATLEADQSSVSNSVSGDRRQSNVEDTSESQGSETELIELMIASKPPPPIIADPSVDIDDDAMVQALRKASIPLHGNLASELAQTFHALARNDVAFRISPASLLSGRDGIVYVNLHIAVNIEAASLRLNNDMKRIDPASLVANEIRPYHTILFPHVSAAELLRNILSTTSHEDGDLSQRRLEKLLLVCDPFKSLNDMSLDTALPLSVVTEAAMSLIESGTCIVVPFIQKSTRFACQNGAVQHMSTLRLEFAQQFSHTIPIFVVVSALTATRPRHGNKGSPDMDDKSDNVTFGDVIRYCRQAFRLYHSDEIINPESNKDDDEVIPSVYRILTERIVSTLQSPAGKEVDIGNAITSMATWLRSRSVITELKDYFVAISPCNPTSLNTIQVPDLKKEAHLKNDKDQYDPRASPVAHEDIEMLYKECMNRKFLTGNVSSTALAWRLGVSNRRIEALRNYGVREQKLLVVTRIPSCYDDWGAP